MPIPPDIRAPGDAGHVGDHNNIADELTALVAADTAETARATAAEALLAPKASPALTGSPTAPTQTAGDSSTKLATTAFVRGAFPNTAYYDITAAQFGADPAGTADSTTAIQACIDAITGAASPSANTRLAKAALFIPPGTYKTTADLIIRSVQSFKVLGAGPGMARIAPHGTGFTTAALLIDGSLDGVYEGFSIQGDGTEQVTDAIRLDWTTAAQRSTTGNCFRDIRVTSTNFVTGISLEGNGTRQVDGTTLDNVVVVGKQTPNAWSTSGNWQKGIAFGSGSFGNNYDHRMSGTDVALCYYGWYCNDSGFALYGSQPAGNAVDFFILPNGQVTLSNIQSQNSGQFITQTSAFSPSVVSVTDVHFVSAYLNSNHYVADIYGGVWSFRNFEAVNTLISGSYVGGVINIRGAAAGVRPAVVTCENIVLNNPLISGITPAAGQSYVVVSNYASYDPSTGNYSKVRGFQHFNGTSWVAHAAVFSPRTYGAAGDGTTDDTTPVLAAFTAASAAGGIVDLGTSAYLTSSAIPAYTGMRLRGTNQQGFTSGPGGTLVNNTTDLFSFTGAVTDIKISDCTLKASAGHVFSAGTATVALLKIDGTVISQTATGKSIWNQTGGGLLDSVIGDNCSFYASPLATVSPWTVTGVAGNFNSVTFRKLRCTMNGNGAVVPFFKIDPGSTAGWNEEIRFEDITWEICSGGAIAMTAAVGVTVGNCANWDIPAVRSDTGCATHTSTTVDDTAAVSGDLNKTISGTGIPAGTRITAVTAGTGYTISQAATATASGLTFTVGGLAGDFYSFKTSAAGYPVRSIQVEGGRAGAGSTSGSGHNDFFADSSCTNIKLDSYGSWGTAPVISSPAGQTTIINGTVASGNPANTFPGVSVAPDIQYFTAAGTATWTKPSGAVTTEVFVQSGGSGGGSGRQGAAGTVRCGGGGGAAGMLVSRKFASADLTSTVTVTVGDGGAGGLAVSATDTGGNAGSFGSTSSFGSYLSGPLGSTGQGGTATTGTGGLGPFGVAGAAGSGGNASASGGAGVSINPGSLGPSGGPAGGGITSGDAAGNGAVGAVCALGGSGSTAGGAGVVDTTTPTTGTSSGVKGAPGGSPGSGAASKTTAAQAGASAYANSGAGGAGGGASLNGSNSGAGGKGGSGFVLVVSFFQ